MKIYFFHGIPLKKINGGMYDLLPACKKLIKGLNVNLYLGVDSCLVAVKGVSKSDKFMIH